MGTTGAAWVCGPRDHEEFLLVWKGRGNPMARRRFTVAEVTGILVHWYAGRSLSEVSDSLGVDRKTIRKYLAPAVAAGITPNGPARSAAQWGVLVAGWFPQLTDMALGQTTWPQI